MNRKMIAAAIAARVNDDFQLGGVFRRRSRASTRACCLRSAGVDGRPVRPRASIVPAAVPRCLLFRLRLVCAMLRQGAYALAWESDAPDHAPPPASALRLVT